MCVFEIQLRIIFDPGNYDQEWKCRREHFYKNNNVCLLSFPILKCLLKCGVGCFLKQTGRPWLRLGPAAAAASLQKPRQDPWRRRQGGGGDYLPSAQGRPPEHQPQPRRGKVQPALLHRAGGGAAREDGAYEIIFMLKEIIFCLNFAS